MMPGEGEGHTDGDEAWRRTADLGPDDATAPTAPPPPPRRNLVRAPLGRLLGPWLYPCLALAGAVWPLYFLGFFAVLWLPTLLALAFLGLIWAVRAVNSPPEYLRHPPRGLFHLCLAFPVLGLFVAVSVPGINFRLLLSTMSTLGVLTLMWAVRLIAYGVLWRRKEVTARARWFLVAPTSGVLCLSVLYLEVPLQVRWTLSRAEFEHEVAEAMAGDDEWAAGGQRIGLYQVRRAYRQGDAVIFYEVNGALSNDAGFAYLPDGPFPELANGSFESPRFRHLSGPWYTWTASW